MYRILTLLLLLLATPALAGSFDWADYGVVTPIRSQMIESGTYDTGTCWAHAADAALETDYLQTTGTTADVYLSPQFLKDSLSGSNVYNPMKGSVVTLTTTGTILNSLDPLVEHGQTGTPNLTKPYSIYRATSFTTLPNDTAYLKSWMQEYGLIITEIDNAAYKQVYHTDTGQYDQPTWNQDWSTYGNHSVIDVSNSANYSESYPNLNQIWYVSGFTGASWHVVDLIGYQDDASWPGGGYWIAKSSYPSYVGPWVPDANGYGDISYAELSASYTMQTTEFGNGRAFYGFDGPAGSLTYNTDNSVTVNGVFHANYNDIPDGSGLNVGNMSYFAPTAQAVPEPNTFVMLIGVVLFILLLTRRR